MTYANFSDFLTQTKSAMLDCRKGWSWMNQYSTGSTYVDFKYKSDTYRVSYNSSKGQHEAVRVFDKKYQSLHPVQKFFLGVKEFFHHHVKDFSWQSRSERVGEMYRSVY